MNKNKQLKEVINRRQQQELQASAKESILSMCSGDGIAYRLFKNQLNNELWCEYRMEFHLNSYKNTPKFLYEEGLAFIRRWTPLWNLPRMAGEAETAFQKYLEAFFDDIDNDNYVKFVEDYPEITEDFIFLKKEAGAFNQERFSAKYSAQKEVDKNL